MKGEGTERVYLRMTGRVKEWEQRGLFQNDRERVKEREQRGLSQNDRESKGEGTEKVISE